VKVLIAGGSGLIGRKMTETMQAQGHEVHVLSRKPSADHHIYWNPDAEEVDVALLKDVEVLVHLCGAGIADRAWTKRRKKELLTSRVQPIHFLWKLQAQMPKLKQSIAVSGVNCYGTTERAEEYREEDAYAGGFIDKLVEEWEEAARIFESRVPVCILRMGVVFSSKGGLIERLAKPIRMGFGAVLGSGKQWISWVHEDDAAASFVHAMNQQLSGVYNVLADNATNRTITLGIGKRCGKKIWMPAVPGIFMKLMFGEMSVLLLKGVRVSNKKWIDSGFVFQHPTLENALDSLEI